MAPFQVLFQLLFNFFSFSPLIRPFRPAVFQEFPVAILESVVAGSIVMYGFEILQHWVSDAGYSEIRRQGLCACLHDFNEGFDCLDCILFLGFIRFEARRDSGRSANLNLHFGSVNWVAPFEVFFIFRVFRNLIVHLGRVFITLLIPQKS